MIEYIPLILGELAQLDTTLLVVLLVIGVVVAAKIFQYLIKVVLVGVIFGVAPIALNFIGVEIAISLNNIASSALIGIALFLLYAAVHTGLRVTKIAMYPFRRFFRRKPKAERIIIREVEREKKKKD